MAMQEAWRAYLGLALGVTETSRKKAEKTVKRLVGKGGATAEQLRDLATDLVATSAANREALAKLVRFEVDRALGVVGLATSEEVTALNARVQELEKQLSESAAPAPAATAALTKKAPAKTAPAKTAPAKTSAVKKAPAKRAVAKKAAASRSGTTASTATGTVAKKAASRKAPARKTTGQGTTS